MSVFSLLERRIEFSDDIMNFAQCYGRHIALRNEADQQFCKMYDSYETIINMVNRVETDCTQMIYSCAAAYIDEVIDAGFYDLNVEIFLEEYVSKITHQWEIINVCDQIVEKYVGIEKEKYDMKKYRDLRKASRGRIVGGGFGVGGALKGIVMAETANMISGLGHNAVNAIGNMGTDAAAQREGQKIYKSIETRLQLQYALKRDLYAVFEGYLLLLEDKLGTRFRIRHVEDKEKVDTIICNISQRELGRDEVLNIIVEMFQMDPYNDNLYRYVLQRFGDGNSELQRLADTFSVRKELDGYKRDALLKIANEMPGETIEECEQIIASLVNAIQRNGIAEDIGEEFLSSFRNRIDRLDQEARTFQDTVYETVEEAVMAREAYETEQAILEKEKSDLAEWRSETDFTNKESLQQLKDRINKSHYKVDEAKAYIKEIDDNLERIDREERTVDGIVYENHESARFAIQDKESYEKFRDNIFAELGNMIDAGQYKEVIDCLRQTEMSNEWKLKMETDWNEWIAVRFAGRIEQSRKYQKVKEESGLGNIAKGAVGIILIGLVISIMFPYALVISVVIAVLGIVSMITETKKNESRKPDYDFIQQLIQYGYVIKTEE